MPVSGVKLGVTKEWQERRTSPFIGYFSVSSALGREAEAAVFQTAPGGFDSHRALCSPSVFAEENDHAPVEESGVLATLSRWRSRVQIPSGALERRGTQTGKAAELKPR